MPIPVSPDVWLDTIHQEYLTDYIKSGGSTVKFICGEDPTLAEAQARLHNLAEAENYFHVHLDAAQLLPDDKRPDLHRIDRFFFAVTKSIDWKTRATAEALSYLESRGIRVQPGRNLNDIDRIAQDNGRDPTDLINQFQRELVADLIRDHGMAIEFRAAIAALVRSQLLPESMSPTTEEVLLEWFAGRTMHGASAALKKIHIFERITRANARHMLASFCRWLPKAGYDGLVVTLDFRPYEHKKLSQGKKNEEMLELIKAAVSAGAPNEELAQLLAGTDAEPSVDYSDLAYLQMLAQMRRFIDEIDWFERFMLVVLTSPAFYPNEPTKFTRNYWNYDALQTRIGQEVHDTKRGNPTATLAQLGGAS